MFPSGTLCYSENKNQVYAHTLVSPHQPPILLIIRLLASLILDMSMIQRKSREFHRQLRVNKNIGRSTNSLLIKKRKSQVIISLSSFALLFVLYYLSVVKIPKYSIAFHKLLYESLSIPNC